MDDQNVLVTGPYGDAGEAILNHLLDDERYEFTLLNRSDHQKYETYVADITDYESIRPAFDGQDAIIHLAAQSDADADFEDVVEPNIAGTYNVLRAIEDAGVAKLIFASSQRVMGLYEEDHAPELYEADYPDEFDPLRLDHEILPKPDGYYGASKVFGENICRIHARRPGAPEQVYALRISSVRTAEYDHPYGDAERSIDRGEEYELGEDDEATDQSRTGPRGRDSDEYEEMVKRLKASWTSQRDFARMFECCLEDDSVTYDVFYAVSGNSARWFDIEHAKAVLRYEPRDDGSEWNSPPNVERTTE